ncbi:IS5/IS1182 family transposase [Actinosynnema sp. NPDC047251]|uniref:IS5/IS1182 family transposase n=1 Tax=Saccharothrix espanaensis TaxID=103731 RepID=UPI00059E5E09|nr:IS5/IS1182 family transposase [Saccharothrix espanaensis]
MAAPAPRGAGRTGLAVGVSAANLHDSQALKPMLRVIPRIRSRCGPRRFCPAKLHADKAYDIDHLRRWLRHRGTIPRIACKNIDPSDRLGRHRWVVESAISGLTGYRRLTIRYERHALTCRAFATLAAALTYFQRLTNPPHQTWV